LKWGDIKRQNHRASLKGKSDWSLFLKMEQDKKIYITGSSGVGYMTDINCRNSNVGFVFRQLGKQEDFDKLKKHFSITSEKRTSPVFYI
jgi:hypothetical protein